MIDDQRRGHEGVLASEEGTPCSAPGAVLLYDGDCGVCERFAAAVARALPSWEVRPARGLAEVVLQLPDGTERGGAAAVNATLAAIHPALAPVLAAVERTAALFALERRAYALFAAHRATISRYIAAKACGLPPGSGR